MPLDERTLPLAVGTLGLLVLGLAIWVTMLQRSQSALRGRLRGILDGKDSGSLDEVLDSNLRQLVTLGERVGALSALQKELEAANRRSVQRIGIVRFNPFADAGGDQSFAIALLDTLGTGIVLSSLNGRAETRVFGKQVSGGRSRHQLSDEEVEAIAKAMRPPDQEG